MIAALIVATVIDLRAGAAPSAVHSLAAVYIGVSVGFGHAMIRWADERFAHRFAGGPAPVRPPRGSPEHARRRRAGWFRHLTAWSVGVALLAGAALLVGDPSEARPLTDRIWQWTLILAIDAAVSLRPAAGLSRREGSPRGRPRRATRA